MSPHSGNTLLLIGVSHRSTALAEREVVALSPDERLWLQRAWCRSGSVDECFVLTTCNRSEFYAVGHDVRRAEAGLRDALARLRGRDVLAELTQPYRRAGRHVSRHLLRVAAGLDSMVLGDLQVLGQVRDAYRTAREAESIGPVFHRLLQRALCAGRRARGETRIAAGHASVPAAAVSLLRSVLGTLANRELAVIGAGETGRQLVRHALTDRSVRLTVVNRSLGAAERLAGPVGGRAAGLDAVPDVLARADAVVCATAAPATIVTTAAVCRAMSTRRGQRLFLLDLAVPRDVDPGAARVRGVTLLTVDSVQRVLADTQARRAAEIPTVEAIVDEELARLEAPAAWVPNAFSLCAAYDSPNGATHSA